MYGTLLFIGNDIRENLQKKDSRSEITSNQNEKLHVDLL